ncbi:hypothetical protein WAJ79_21415, partial [Acinetobacter baumannii]
TDSFNIRAEELKVNYMHLRFNELTTVLCIAANAIIILGILIIRKGRHIGFGQAFIFTGLILNTNCFVFALKP